MEDFDRGYVAGSIGRLGLEEGLGGIAVEGWEMKQRD